MKEVKDEDLVAEKKTYHSPRLTNFGHISDLTQATGNGPTNDHGSNMMAS